MEKIDLTKVYKDYYSAKKTVTLIDIKSAHYVSICGKGDPNLEGFSKKVSALYSVSYALKFLYKSKSKDFTVAKLEGLWWFDENRFKVLSPVDAPEKIPRSEWEYRLLIQLPSFVQSKDVERAKEKAFQKSNATEVNDVNIFDMSEGRCIQILHEGSYDTEPKTLQELHQFMQKNNLQRNGFHHEIYLSDARKTAPEKLKTILRQPVK